MIEIKRNFSSLIFSAGLALLFLNVGNLAFADDERDQLIKTVKSFELQFENFSVDVTTTKWLGENREHFFSSEGRRVIQWGDRFYESSYSRDASHKLQDVISSFSNRLTNAQISIGSSALDNIEIHTRDCRPPARFQPYAQLLATLGFEGTLSAFLELGHGNLDTMNVEIGETEEFEGLATQRIRGVFQLPGSSKVKSIDLRLAIGHAYLPSWGQFTHTVEGQVLHRIETQVKVFADHDEDGRTFVREMSSTTSVVVSPESTASSSAPESTKSPKATVHSDALKPLTPPHSSMLIECDGKFISAESLESMEQMDRSSDDAVTKIIPNQRQQSENNSNAQTIKRVIRPSYVNWIILDGIVLGLIGISMNPKIWAKA